nr:MAG TPA: hypothetical protein [Caudoviricetes sp.]
MKRCNKPIRRENKCRQNNYVRRVRKLAAIVRGAVAFSLWRVGLLKRYNARRMIRIGLKSVRNMYRIEQAILKTRKRHE